MTVQEDLRRQNAAVVTLAVIVGITAAWWTLALWPAEPTLGAAPGVLNWVERTRLACFGAQPGGLPDAGGWMVMTGQPLAMLLVLFAAWGRDVRAGLARVQRHLAGQLMVGATLAGCLAGVAAVIVRVRIVDARPFETSTVERLVSKLTRVNDTVPTMRLADQTGRPFDLRDYRGKAVLVTFAYAHCQTVCPLVVSDLLEVQRRLGADAPEVVIVTMDPHRDTPSRLPSIAEQWKLGANGHVLSGEADQVELALNRWRIPRVRNEVTGEYSHPTIVYVIGPDGRIAYVTPGGAELIAAAVKSL
jgi:cytochrome oxidase Cu insertion factor (SCO1/SenC/PrrC family)